MRSSSRIPALALFLLLALPLLSGCSHSGGSMLGGGGANGDSSEQDSKQQSQQQQSSKQKGGQTQAPYTAPQASVSGQPSAESDRGSSTAVSKGSVTQPGAPQGTLKNDQTPPAAGSASAPRR